MGDLAIDIPARLDALNAFRVGQSIVALATASEIPIDMSRLSTPDPFGMLYLASIARAVRSSGGSFRLIGADRHSYAAHMGFLSEFSDDYASIEGAVRENERYIAIKTVTKEQLNAESEASGKYHIGEAIELLSLRLAKLLVQSEGGELVNALTYCLREIIRNTYEHSGSDEVMFCAQFRPAAERVDLAFADCGKGVMRTLARNPRVSINSNRDALKIALLPGVSGTDTGRRAPARSDDPWENSGYGLYMTQRICRDGGVFVIASGDALLRLTGDRELIRDSGAHVGTVVGLTMRLGTLEELRTKLLRVFSKEGGALSRNFKKDRITASTASVTLRMTVDDTTEGTV